MKIPINKDPENLNRSVFGGRSLWQYACIFFSVGIAVAFVLLFQDRLGITLSSVICIALVMPTGYIGLFSKHGLDYFTYRKSKRSVKQGVYLYYSPVHKAPPDETGADKKNKAAYIIKNIITGGKNA